MHSFLENIVTHKQTEIALLRQEALSSGQKQHTLRYPTPGRFKQAIAHRAVIAEIKRKSPSLGILTNDDDILDKVSRYCRGGANAISVLTDQTGFNGHLRDLQQVKQHVLASDTPLLRKDFILDELQIVESIAADADAILLIVALLGEQTELLYQFAKQRGIDVVVEVHNKAELDLALQIKADIIGVNNRNLHTLAIDINHSFELIKHIPADVIKISESGIDSVATARQLYDAGFNALLIGSYLMQQADPAAIIQAIRSEHD
jgi:indole-3-glycerol phosphate synthase